MEVNGNKMDASYYQDLHDNNDAFKKNNWLLKDFDKLKELKTSVSSVLELGCGNGRFLELANTIWDDVTGVDWAKSSHIEDLITNHHNIKFIQADVTALQLDRVYDLVVSADFLEHLAPDDLPNVIQGMLRIGKMNHHKIACYDDGHSHLSIFPSEKWLELFRSQPGGENVRIIQEELRKGREGHIVVTISNAEFD
ncbi:class I SAM-dependent methyltransferase [Marinomonas primoryensis]|uniref:Class I SAM-dependent methyltransferase n=1 Tax=Marinomonas primoryensis TaxID=178399 RepID=A0ABV0KZ92_9GAMM